MEAVGLKTTASSCCGQECRVEGRTTSYYVCVLCGKPCDDLRGVMEDWEGREEDEDNRHNR